MKTLIQEIQSFVKTEVDLSFMTQKNADRLNYYLDTFFVKKEKELITKSFIAGYNSRSNEDMIGGTGNEENEYYDSTFGDSNEDGI